MTKLNLLNLALLGGVFCGTVLPLQGQDVDRLGHPSWMSTPKPQMAADSTTVDGKTDIDPLVRKARTEIFNVPPWMRASAQDLTQSSSIEAGVGVFNDFSQPQSLPVSYSDAIASGIVTSTQPFLTEDHTQVFSELTFMPDTILKDLSKALAPEKPAVILSRGGAIKLLNGQIAKNYAGGGSSPINLKKHYLLFMHYVPEAQAYTVIKSWDISGEHPKEMDEDGHSEYQSITADSSYTTSNESLMALVRSRIEHK